MMLSELKFRYHSIFWQLAEPGQGIEVYLSTGRGGGWGPYFGGDDTVPAGLYGILVRSSTGGIEKTYGPLTEIEAQAVLFDLTKAPADA